MPDARDSDFTRSGRRRELGRVRILVIDDDPQARALIEMALADAPFEGVLDIVSTAAEGLRRIEEHEHDVYLVDYRLPDGNGLELIQEAKENGATRPFILMTGFGSGDIDEAALEAGAADYVEKHLVGVSRTIDQVHPSRLAGQPRAERARRAAAPGPEDGGHRPPGRRRGPRLQQPPHRDDRVHGHDLRAHARGRSHAARRAGDPQGGDRAAALTRQLLAFGRKQFLQPVVLDVNATVQELLQMLPRVIGEHIQTTTRLAPALHRVTADASQMEQVLVNLVLNARDAMPTGGAITIETENVDLTGERVADAGLSLQPGPYVTLSVSDTGGGMDADTRSHAFEPFFTTKAKGKGTGLGLATVYGIVDQSGGAITIETAVGHGTTVRIYLPAATAPSEAPPPEPPPKVTSGTESILLVEDNDIVRELARRTLKDRGYKIYEARNAEKALELMAHGADVQLLLTDVVMPGLSGPNLAARLIQQRPRLRVLYMSGYSEDATSAHGTFWGGVPLLQKPFTTAQLAERVRLALDSAPNQT